MGPAIANSLAMCPQSAKPMGARFSTEVFGDNFVRLKTTTLSSSSERSNPIVVCTRPKALSPSSSSMTADVLQDKFGCSGVRFVDVVGGTTPATELKLRNGSSARMMLSRAQITSYKASMWHGAEEEMLHAVRSQSGNSTSTSIRGGIELRFDQLKDPLSSILPSTSNCWLVESVDCQPSEYAQMTLTNFSYPEGAVGQSARGLLQFKYVVTLSDDSLSAALVISNTGPVAVDFTGSIVSHLAVSSTDGTFAVGLRGHRYRSLVRPKQVVFDPTKLFSQLWSSKDERDRSREDILRENSSSGTDARQELEGGTWIVESEDYSQLHGGMDRLFISPPDSFSIMDRGRRRSLIFERHGFSEICLANPGPDSKLPDWNKFVCVGPAQSCQSVRLHENREWRGAVTLLNPGSGDME